jgi:hypothetical protein
LDPIQIQGFEVLSRRYLSDDMYRYFPDFYHNFVKKNKGLDLL